MKIKNAIVVFAAVALCATNVIATPQLPFKRGTNCRGLDESAYSTSTWGKTYIYGLDSTYTDIKAKGFDFVRLSVDHQRGALSPSADGTVRWRRHHRDQRRPPS